MAGLRVKLFQGEASGVENQVNAWLAENAKAEVRDVKVCSGEDGRVTALVLYFPPREAKGLGFSR